MTLNERIESFAALGEMLRASVLPGKQIPSALQKAIEESEAQNPWFTHENIMTALDAIAAELTVENLARWLDPYRERIGKLKNVRTIATVMAGNIPLAGFHDFLCILITGNRILARLSSHDNRLLPSIASIFEEMNPAWKQFMTFTEEKLSSFDAVIATGSNNTSRYFEYYFSKYPHIIRKNRNGVAVISGRENDDELSGLADDVFLYFGLGCRNVSKLFFPEGYGFEKLFKAFGRYDHYFRHNKYRNNYNYYKSIYLVSRTPFSDGDFFLLREDPATASPVSVIYFEYYRVIADLEKRLSEMDSQIQCVVSPDPLSIPCIKPGRSQYPGLRDYPDGVDTVEFILK